MRRFLKRLVETGAVCWFAFAVMLVGGAVVAAKAHVMIQTGGPSRYSSPVLMDSRDMADFWWVTAVVSFWIGVGVMGSPRPGK